MDLVYTVGTGGHDEELKYSIRSMEKYLHGFDRIFVVGHSPPGLDVIHIPAEDAEPNNRALNIYKKVLTACAIPGLSDNFICAADDHFLLRDYDAGNLPCYNCGCLAETLEKMSNKNYYRKHLAVTYQALMDRGLPTINFNVHFPVVYNKNLFPHIMQEFDWNIPMGYVSKSLYLNSLRVGGEQVKDCKIFTPKTKTAIYRKIKDSGFFSTDKHSINPEMLEVMQELFPVGARKRKNDKSTAG